MFGIWMLRSLLVISVGLFVAQMVTRLRLILRAKNNFSLARPGSRLLRLAREVVFQSKVIRGRPLPGLGHALVFWGFVILLGYSAVQFLLGLGIADLTGAHWFHVYRLILVPFAVAVLIGIVGLLIRRMFVRPPGLGSHVSGESVLIGVLITALMITFLLEFALTRGTTPYALNWWTHVLIILAFLPLIPSSKHLHLFVSPATVFLESPVLGTVPNLDFEKEEVGFETVAELEGKEVLDAFTCVECGRCQMSCPAYGTGKRINPKEMILANEKALLAHKLDARLNDLYGVGVLWQCTTCGACESQCPVGVEHLPLIIGARRGLVSNGEAPDFLTPIYSNIERRSNLWGFPSDQRAEFVASAGLERFDPARHEYLMWLGCSGSYDADFQKSLVALFDILRAQHVTFGVLAEERCSGDVAKRTGNEFLFQELATHNIEQFRTAGVKKILTSCPHCLKTIGDDYRRFGFEAEVVHTAVFVSELMQDLDLQPGEEVTLHDPCYLARYAGHVDEPRALLERAGAIIKEPVRNRENPFCCGGGGGLLFQEQDEGKRISQERFEQLQATGAGTIITACPFCALMLKDVQASSNATTEVVDLIAFVDRRLRASIRPQQQELPQPVL